MSNDITDTDEALEISGIKLKRGALHLGIGKIYNHKTTGIQYEMLELLDMNQALFKNLSGIRLDKYCSYSICSRSIRLWL